MEFGYTERQEQIRKEVKEFLLTELPSGFDEYNIRKDVAIEKFDDEFLKKGGRQ